MKKALAMVLCLALVLSCLAGCGSGGTESTQGQIQTNGGTEGENGEPITLKIGVQASANCEDYYNNALTKWLEEQTGYHLEFEKFASSAEDAKTQISTRMAIGDELPDIIWNIPLGKSVYKEYGEDGYLMDLKPYFDDKEKSATFWDRLSELPEYDQERVVRNITDVETGAMYAFPSVEYTVIDPMDYMVFINQQWLDKLNLKMPTNTEELYDVLVAFRDNDPNGNGLKDEIPLVGANTLSDDAVNWLLNMFCYLTDTRYWNVDDNGQLYMPFATDEYREGLKYINKLVKEGLMPDSCFSMKYQDEKALINTGDGVAKVGVFAGHPTLVLENGDPVIQQYEAMPYWGNAVFNDNSLNMKTYITTDCENPDAAWNLLMTMCSKEGSLRIRYGQKGVDWDDADPGSKTFLGTDAEIKIINEGVSQQQGTENWKNISATVLVNAENESVQIDDNLDDWTQKKFQLLADVRENFTAGMNNNPKTILPALILTDEESEATENERTNVANYIKQMRSNFCININDPSSDGQWNDYLKELNNLGIEVWREQAQGVYDRQLEQ